MHRPRRHRRVRPWPQMHEAAYLARLLAGVAWPRSLRGATANDWRRIAPGVRWSRVTLPDAAANLYLLRVDAGKSLPVHSHRGGELTLVLHGAFHDGSERFAVWRLRRSR